MAWRCCNVHATFQIERPTRSGSLTGLAIAGHIQGVVLALLPGIAPLLYSYKEGLR